MPIWHPQEVLPVLNPFTTGVHGAGRGVGSRGCRPDVQLRRFKKLLTPVSFRLSRTLIFTLLWVHYSKSPGLQDSALQDSDQGEPAPACPAISCGCLILTQLGRHPNRKPQKPFSWFPFVIYAPRSLGAVIQATPAAVPHHAVASLNTMPSFAHRDIHGLS